MGIRGMKKYLTQNHSLVASEKVDLLALSKPVRLIVDYMNFRFFCEELLGTRASGVDPIPPYEEFARRLERMLELLESSGVHLEFVRDAAKSSRSSGMKEVWKQRNESQLEKLRAVEAAILNCRAAPLDFMAHGVGETALALMRDQRYYLADGDADKLCADLLFHRRDKEDTPGTVFAVLSNDAEYAIRPKGRVIPLEGFDVSRELRGLLDGGAGDLQHLWCWAYEAERVAQQLDVPESELAEIAILAGNDATKDILPRDCCSFGRPGMAARVLRGVNSCPGVAVRISEQGGRQADILGHGGSAEAAVRRAFDCGSSSGQVKKYLRWLEWRERGMGGGDATNLETPAVVFDANMPFEEFMASAHETEQLGAAALAVSSADYHRGEVWEYGLPGALARGMPTFFDFCGDFYFLFGGLFAPAGQKIKIVGTLSQEATYSEYYIHVPLCTKDSRYFYSIADLRTSLAVLKRAVGLVPGVKNRMTSATPGIRDAAAAEVAKAVLDAAFPAGPTPTFSNVFAEFLCGFLAALALPPRRPITSPIRWAPELLVTLREFKVLYLTIAFSLGAEGPKQNLTDPQLIAYSDFDCRRFAGLSAHLPRMTSAAPTTPQQKLRHFFLCMFLMKSLHCFTSLSSALCVPRIASTEPHRLFRKSIFSVLSSLPSVDLDALLRIPPVAGDWREIVATPSYKMAFTV